MMNLPMDAVEFLDCFIGAFRNADEEIWLNRETGKLDLPMIHVYGFTSEGSIDKARTYFVDRIANAMQFPAFSAANVTCFHAIRDVAPQSHMYSTSFRLPEEVALMGPSATNPTAAAEEVVVQEGDGSARVENSAPAKRPRQS